MTFSSVAFLLVCVTNTILLHSKGSPSQAPTAKVEDSASSGDDTPEDPNNQTSTAALTMKGWIMYLGSFYGLIVIMFFGI